MGKPYTAQQRVAALMAGWTGWGTQNLYAAMARVQSAKSARQRIFKTLQLCADFTTSSNNGRAALPRSPNIRAARQRPPYQLFTT